MKRLFTILLAVLLPLTMTACGSKEQPSEESNTPVDDNMAHASFILVEEDGTEYPYELTVTPGQSLRNALFEAGLITEEEQFAMFVCNIDGHIADTLNDGVTWWLTDKDGNELENEIEGEFFCKFDMVQVDDGDVIYARWYVVPDFD